MGCKTKMAAGSAECFVSQPFTLNDACFGENALNDLEQV